MFRLGNIGFTNVTIFMKCFTEKLADTTKLYFFFRTFCNNIIKLKDIKRCVHNFPKMAVKQWNLATLFFKNNLNFYERASSLYLVKNKALLISRMIFIEIALL